MDFLIKAAQLLMSLSILVVLHELGHFIPAKLFKTRVEKFYLFFDPWFSLVKKKIGSTEYGIGWLPLGGYVKISGMIDESMDKEQMKKPPESWEFRAKPAWQRLIIMLGGVVVNLILGIFIYSMTLYVYGEKYLSNDGVSVSCSELAKELEFQNGDKIIAIDGVKVNRFFEITPKILTSKMVVVERDGVYANIEITSDKIAKFIEKEKENRFLFSARIPTIVASVQEGSNAEEGGLKKGDVITAINGVNCLYYDEFKDDLNGRRNESVELTVMRGEIEKQLGVSVSNEGFLGFIAANGMINSDLEKFNLFDLTIVEYTFFESFPAGYNKAIDRLGFYIAQFKLIFSPKTKAYKGVGGFGAIGSLFPSTWSWEVFWNLTAFLSLMLAFMNILPIPALDGGHVLFLVYEIIVGKPAPEKFMEYSQMVGMILLLGLLVYANGNDVYNWWTEK